MEKEKCKNITTVKKITSGVTAMIAMTAGIIMVPFIANASSENIQNSFGGGYKDTADEYVVDTYGNDNEISEQANDTGGVYDFKDNKTTGTVTVTKVWNDGLTNEEREIPDIKISTKKPSKSALGYTVTFHGNGMKFADGAEENMVVYNSAGEIVQGEYKMAIGNNVAWYTDKTGKGKTDVSSDGILSVPITEDIDLWAKEMTFSLISGSSFKNKIPSTVTEIIFTDEMKPASAKTIDVDSDGDGGVVAWAENDGTVMKVSTQIKGVKVQAARNSNHMFYEKRNLKNIDLKMLDTSNVTDMSYMFSYCNGLTSLDLTPLDTSNVETMEYMFYWSTCLTSLDLASLNTSNVTNMNSMFSGCSGLISLDLISLDTSNVKYMIEMFRDCDGLTSLDLTSFDVSNLVSASRMFYWCNGLINLNLTSLNMSKVTDMSSMLECCKSLTNLNLTQLKTSNVTDMSRMFYSCNSLKSLDLTPLDTSKVTNMSEMFSGCSGLKSLDLTPLDTSNVTDMHYMFGYCGGLKILDLTSFNTTNVTNMSSMFYDCMGLTSLDLTPLNTANVTDMSNMFQYCSKLTSLTTGQNFKFVGTNYRLSGTWQNAAGETFNGNDGTANFPSNVADTYTEIS